VKIGTKKIGKERRDAWGVPAARKLTVHSPRGRARGFAVFLHGFGSNQSGEKAAALRGPLLERGVAYATYDSRGTGDRPEDFLDLTPTHLVEDCVAVVRALLPRFGRAVLVGSSLGAFAAAWTAALHPRLVAGLVLVAPAFRFLDRHVTSLPRREVERWRRLGFREMKGPHFDARLSFDLYRDARNYRHSDLLARSTAPSLVLHGFRDDLVPISESLEFLEGCRSSEVDLVVFKSGDHRLTSRKDDVAALAAEAARRFLDAAPRR